MSFSIESDDNRLKINGYNFIKAGYPSNLKKDGVCIYSKENFPVNKCDDICTFDNCFVTVTCSKNECSFQPVLFAL